MEKDDLTHKIVGCATKVYYIMIPSVGYYKNGYKIGKWHGYNDLGEKDEVGIFNRKGKLKLKKRWNFEKQRWLIMGIDANIFSK